MGRSQWTALCFVLVFAGCSGTIDGGRAGGALEAGAAGAPVGEGSAGSGGDAPLPGDDAAPRQATTPATPPTMRPRSQRMPLPKLRDHRRRTAPLRWRDGGAHRFARLSGRSHVRVDRVRRHIQIQLPYDLKVSDRYAVGRGHRHFLIKSTDKPLEMGNTTEPRTEARWSSFTTGQHMWTGDVLVDSPSTHVCVSVHTTATGAGPVYLRVMQGDLEEIGGN